MFFSDIFMGIFNDTKPDHILDFKHFGSYTSKMFKRDIESELLLAYQEYPIVTLMGPRQSGKTTVIRHLFPDKPYYNLERPDIRELLTIDPMSILNKHPDGVVFDEVQRLPQLLSYLQVIVDEKKQKGMYILTGSHQSELHEAVAQSLAGRTAILHLLPLCFHEINHAKKTRSLEEYLYQGFLPNIHHENTRPTHYYRNYLETYIEKDVRKLINLKDLLVFQRFLKLCAGRVGQIVNTNGIGNELGVSHHTIKHWLSILQATFIIQLLPPYFENFGKRVIKSPKLYFFDVGLASYLLDIEEIKQLERDPLRGNLFENMVVMDLYKTRFNQGSTPNLYYYRDSLQHEIDIIYKKGHELIPIEIKSSQTIDTSFLKGLKYFQQITNHRSKKSYLIYSGKEDYPDGETAILHFSHASEEIMAQTHEAKIIKQSNRVEKNEPTR